MNARLDEELFLDLLRAGHRARMCAHGVSMLPTIFPGAEVELEPSPERVAPGDVLLARVGERRLVLHRLIELRPDGRLLLKGDALGRPDAPVAATSVLGRAVWVSAGWPRDLTTRSGRSVNRALACASWLGWKVGRRLRRLVAPASVWHA